MGQFSSQFLVLQECQVYTIIGEKDSPLQNVNYLILDTGTVIARSNAGTIKFSWLRIDT